MLLLNIDATEVTDVSRKTIIVAAQPTLCVQERQQKMNIHVITDLAALEEVKKGILSAAVVGIDFETTGLDPLVNRIRLVQIACQAEDGSVVVWVIFN